MDFRQARLEGGRINRDLLALTQKIRSLEKGDAGPSTRSSKLVRALEGELRACKEVSPTRPSSTEMAGERSE